jgi:hypothetical protein
MAAYNSMYPTSYLSGYPTSSYAPYYNPYASLYAQNSTAGNLGAHPSVSTATLPGHSNFPQVMSHNQLGSLPQSNMMSNFTAPTSTNSAGLRSNAVSSMPNHLQLGVSPISTVNRPAFSGLATLPNFGLQMGTLAESHDNRTYALNDVAGLARSALSSSEDEEGDDIPVNPNLNPSSGTSANGLSAQKNALTRTIFPNFLLLLYISFDFFMWTPSRDGKCTCDKSLDLKLRIACLLG